MTQLRTKWPTRLSRYTTALWISLLVGALLAQSGPAQSGPDRPGSDRPGQTQSSGETAAADAMVYQAFPAADSYRRIVRGVDQAARTAIEKQLSFKVHFDELGPHTLFVAFRGRKPVGLLYLRHEEAEWGLAEISWALTLDLRVVSFQFKRGRSLQQRELESSGFQGQLVGANLGEIEKLLAGERNTAMGQVPNGAEELARMVLRSGAKALLVTDTVWRDEIAKLQDLGMGFDAFPTAERFHRRVMQFELAADGDKQSVSAHVVHATGKGNSQLGAVVRTESKVGEETMVLRWVIDGSHRILDIVPARSWPNDDLRLACSELEGQLLGSLPDADNPLRTMACGLGEVMLRLNPTRDPK